MWILTPSMPLSILEFWKWPTAQVLNCLYLVLLPIICSDVPLIIFELVQLVRTGHWYFLVAAWLFQIAFSMTVHQVYFFTLWCQAQRVCMVDISVLVSITLRTAWNRYTSNKEWLICPCFTPYFTIVALQLNFEPQDWNIRNEVPNYTSFSGCVFFCSSRGS